MSDLDAVVRSIVRDELRAAGLPGRRQARAMTVRDAAERLAVDPKTVRRLVQRGELRAVRVGNRSLRILASDIDAMLAAKESLS